MAPVGFIGAGNMAQAIITGVTRTGVYAADDILIHEVNPERADFMTRNLHVRSVPTARELVQACDTVVLAIKPKVIESVLAGIGQDLHDRLVISIVAGVPLGFIQERIGREARLVRVMPNTPALVQQGASALAASPACRTDDVQVARDLFAALGLCLEVDEDLLDGVTGLSGSGPAFCFLVLEALSDGGVRAGLPRDIATQLAAATMKGAAEMVLATGKHPGELKDMVTSPGGTTIEGVSVLEKCGLRSALIEAVYAAYRRSCELGR